MKLTFNILFFVLFPLISFCQNGLTDYKDIIDLDDEYELSRPNLEELKQFDLSQFWIDNPSERRFGFIGNNYRRLRIKFLSIIKNNDQPNQYFIYGKSKVSDNICPFQGIIEIKESYYIKSLEYPNGKTGILAGEYRFYEDPDSNHSGIFKGRFVTYWYKDEDGIIKYNDLWDVSAMYNNNQFAGNWSAYAKSNIIKANWGDGRISQSDELDTGTSEFHANFKYNSFGWESLNKAWGGGYSEEEMQEARDKELETWWKEK